MPAADQRNAPHPSPPAVLLVQDFTLVLSPGVQSVPSGGTATLTFAVGSVNGYNQPVTLRNMPDGTDGGEPGSPSVSSDHGAFRRPRSTRQACEQRAVRARPHQLRDAFTYQHSSKNAGEGAYVAA